MSKRGENIRKRTDGRWEGRFFNRITGKYKYFYGKSYSEVRQKRLEYAASYESEKVNCIGNKQICMSEVFDIWLNEHNLLVKQSTYSNYSNIIELHLKPMFGDMKINTLTIEDINENLVKWLQSSAKELSAKYIHDILSILRSSLSYAAGKYGIALNIKEMISIPAKSDDITVLSNDEQKVLVQFLNENNDSMKLGIILCLYTGMRLGEICALKWSDIHIKDGYIDINKTLFRTKNINNITINGKIPKTIIMIDKPKTLSSIRKIPLCDFIEKKLADMGEYTPDNYFLTNSKKYIEPRLYQLHFRNILNEAGIRYTKFHTLRHTFATNCINAGCDVKSLSEILGHSSVKITLDRYVHPSMQVKKNQLDKLTVYSR